MVDRRKYLLVMCSVVGAMVAAPAHAAPSQPVQALPIAQGIYADQQEGCARATGVFYYDGSNFGNINQGGPGFGPSASVERIRRVAPAASGRGSDANRYYRGFTLAWAQDTGPYGDIAVKAVSPNSFTRRFVSFGNGNIGGRVDVDDTTHVKCSFTQLSSPMQRAIKTTRPQLAGPAAAAVGTGRVPPRSAASSSSTPPAPVAPFSIRPGHYVPVQAQCSVEGWPIFYYDGRRFGWIDASPFNPNHMDPVSHARKSSTGWVIDPPTRTTLRVLAVDRIVTSDPSTGTETMRWCASDQVRASARPR